MEYKIQEETLTAIADAIRQKTGIQNQYTPVEMPGAIENIPSGSSGGLIYTSNCVAKSNGIVLPGIIGTARIPTPEDCPFECNAEFLGTNSAEYIVTSSGDGSRTYQRTKYSGSKYVIVVAVQFSGYNNILYISPDSPDAVEFQADNYEPVASSTDSYVYNGTTWYFSSTGYAISGEMDIQRTTAPIYPEPVTLNGSAYSDTSKAAILQYVGASLKPTPNDCPFTCNLTYFMDSPKEWTINGGNVDPPDSSKSSYEKANSNYAVGLCVQINTGGEYWTVPVLFSPLPTTTNAIQYQYQGYYGTSDTVMDQTFDYKYDDDDDNEPEVTWYSSTSYGTWGHWIAENIAMYDTSDIINDGNQGHFSNVANLRKFLRFMQVKNKPIQGGGN